MGVAKVSINNRTIIDITDTTATADRIVQGYTAYGADGEKVTGTYTGSAVNNQNKTVTPTKSQQSITADSGYTGLGTVTINSIPLEYIIPTGELSITANGTSDVTNYASVSVNVQPTLQSKTVTPTKSQQTVSPDTNYDALSSVTVNAIPAQYITTTDATATAADISNGKTAYVNGSKVTGSLSFITCYTGTSDPSSSLGQDGDVYLKVAS